MFCAYTRRRYQVSVYRTIGPMVYFFDEIPVNNDEFCGVLSVSILFAYVPYKGR